MTLFSLISGTCKNTFFSFFPLFFSYMYLACKPLKQFSKNLLFGGSSIWNLNSTNTLHHKTNTIDKFWFQILLFRFSRRMQFGTKWLCNYSIIHIISFNHSFILFFITQFLSLGGMEQFLHVIATIY